MGAPASLLPELEDVVQHGSAEKRAETLRRITTLFLDGASNFKAEHIALFDDVIGCLIEQIEAETARALQAIRSEVADLTVIATQKVTGKVLDAADHKRLIDEAIGELDFSALQQGSPN